MAVYVSASVALSYDEAGWLLLERKRLQKGLAPGGTPGGGALPPEADEYRRILLKAKAESKRLSLALENSLYVVVPAVLGTGASALCIAMADASRMGGGGEEGRRSNRKQERQPTTT